MHFPGKYIRWVTKTLNEQIKNMGGMFLKVKIYDADDVIKVNIAEEIGWD